MTLLFVSLLPTALGRPFSVSFFPSRNGFQHNAIADGQQPDITASKSIDQVQVDKWSCPPLLGESKHAGNVVEKRWASKGS